MSKYKTINTIVFACLINFTLSSVGWTKPPIMASKNWLILVSLGQISIDSDVANEQAVDESANFIRFGVEAQDNEWLYGAGISGFLYSDSEGFKQNVVDQFGNPSTQSSSASSFNLYAEGGYTIYLSSNIRLDGLLGYEAVTQSSRSISNCADCASEDINIDAGLYYVPRIRYSSYSGFDISLATQYYFSGDIKSAFYLNLAWNI